MARAPDPECDAIAMAVGHALCAWSFVENRIADLFAQVSGMQLGEAHVLMGSLIGFDARLQICHSLMIRRLHHDPEHLAIWECLHKKLAKNYKSRHDVAHFTFVGMARGTRLVPFWSIGSVLLGRPQDGLGVAEIADKESRFVELGQAVNWFEQSLTATGVQPPTSREPDTHLIQTLRKKVVQTLAGQASLPRPSPE